jgi:hypothetical protein
MIASVLRRAGVLGAATVLCTAVAAPALAACEAWKGGSEIRCVSQNPNRMLSDTRGGQIKNISGAPVTFRTEQWDSACGWPGSSKGAPAEATLPPGGQMDFTLNTPPLTHALAGAQCTEIFVFSCRSGGQGVRCMDSLSAGLVQGGSILGPFGPWSPGSPLAP